MANFCPYCGQPIHPEDVFCESCGSRLKEENDANHKAAEPGIGNSDQAPVYAGNGEVREGFPQPGFSDRVNHPEILAAVSKNRKTSKIWMLFLVPLPLIGFCLYALITAEMDTSDAFRYGGIASLIFLLLNVFSLFKSRAEKSYEAVVTDKYSKKRADKSRDGSGNRETTSDYDYVTVARTTDGKTKKIVETDHGVIWAYHHLQVGDRFRYHPQFAVPYELYDKTRANALYCVSCGAKNPVTADRCMRCHIPLLK